MKKVLKSVVAVVLCLAMVLSLAACGPKYTNGISTEEFTDKKDRRKLQRQNQNRRGDSAHGRLLFGR